MYPDKQGESSVYPLRPALSAYPYLLGAQDLQRFQALSLALKINDNIIDILFKIL